MKFKQVQPIQTRSEEHQTIEYGDVFVRQNESILNDPVLQQQQQKISFYIYLKNKSKLQQLPLFN